MTREKRGGIMIEERIDIMVMVVVPTDLFHPKTDLFSTRALI